MLAQNFMTAAELKLSEKEHAALIKVLGMLERGELIHADLTKARRLEDRPDDGEILTNHFNMDQWRNKWDCGTVACIGGTAELVGGFRFRSGENGQLGGNLDLEELCYPNIASGYADITPQEAAQALRNYLTTGKAKWEEVLD